MDRATLDRLKAKDYKFDQRYEELADIQTKFNLEREYAKKQNDNKSTRYDFLPIVKINNSENSKNAIISIRT